MHLLRIYGIIPNKVNIIEGKLFFHQQITVEEQTLSIAGEVTAQNQGSDQTGSLFEKKRLWEKWLSSLHNQLAPTVRMHLIAPKDRKRLWASNARKY